MRTILKEYGLIVVALGTIFGCGLAVGHRLGSASRPVPEPVPAPAKVSSWEENAMVSLTAALALSPEQQAAIRPDLAATASEIKVARGDTLRRYQGSLLDFIDRISPKLDETQRKKLETDRKKLQTLFSAGLESDGAASNLRMPGSLPRP